ncbi:hypothetical protein DENSPDRAFT_108029 [Dentipellis sp. KUC8613]|nr:hypothetical protein DENSPDRAFT_108029 [Dentipellis sp. KUC8613]
MSFRAHPLTSSSSPSRVCARTVFVHSRHLRALAFASSRPLARIAPSCPLSHRLRTLAPFPRPRALCTVAPSSYPCRALLVAPAPSSRPLFPLCPSRCCRPRLKLPSPLRAVAPLALFSRPSCPLVPRALTPHSPVSLHRRARCALLTRRHRFVVRPSHPSRVAIAPDPRCRCTRSPSPRLARRPVAALACFSRSSRRVRAVSPLATSRPLCAPCHPLFTPFSRLTRAVTLLALCSRRRRPVTPLCRPQSRARSCCPAPVRLCATCARALSRPSRQVRAAAVPLSSHSSRRYRAPLSSLVSRPFAPPTRPSAHSSPGSSHRHRACLPPAPPFVVPWLVPVRTARAPRLLAARALFAPLSRPFVVHCLAPVRDALESMRLCPPVRRAPRALFPSRCSSAAVPILHPSRARMLIYM